MPTYQYACTQCSEELEAVQSFSDPALSECPVCGGRLRKVFSAVGVVFKGSGFYKNDSRSAPAGAKSGDGDGSSGGAAKAEGGAKGDAGTTTDGGAAKADSGTKADSAKKADGGTKSGSSDSGSASGAKGRTPAASGGKTG